VLSIAGELGASEYKSKPKTLLPRPITRPGIRLPNYLKLAESADRDTH